LPTALFYPLSLHDALPIWLGTAARAAPASTSAMTATSISRRIAARRLLHAKLLADLEGAGADARVERLELRDRDALFGCDRAERDRKSTRLNSSHDQISYA